MQVDGVAHDLEAAASADVIRGGADPDVDGPRFEHEAARDADVAELAHLYLKLEDGRGRWFKVDALEADQFLVRASHAGGTIVAIELHHLGAFAFAGVCDADRDDDRAVNGGLPGAESQVGVFEACIAQPATEGEQGRGRHVEVPGIVSLRGTTVSAAVLLSVVHRYLARVAWDAVRELATRRGLAEDDGGYGCSRGLATVVPPQQGGQVIDDPGHGHRPASVHHANRRDARLGYGLHQLHLASGEFDVSGVGPFSLGDPLLERSRATAKGEDDDLCGSGGLNRLRDVMRLVITETGPSHHGDLSIGNQMPYCVGKRLGSILAPQPGVRILGEQGSDFPGKRL